MTLYRSRLERVPEEAKPLSEVAQELKDVLEELLFDMTPDIRSQSPRLLQRVREALERARGES